MQISVPGEIFDTHVITRLPTCRAAFRAPRITVAGQSRTHTGLPLVTLFLRVSFVNAIDREKYVSPICFIISRAGSKSNLFSHGHAG